MDTELLEFRIEEGFSPNSSNFQKSLKPTTFGSTVTLLKENNCSHYGKFYFSGLQKGQGITVANALRRVLLYDIFGIGLTKAKFHLSTSQTVKNNTHDSVLGSNTPKLHEFSTVSGMKESILEFLIHLRSIIWTKPLVPFSIFRGKLNLHNVINSTLDFNKTSSTQEVFILQAKHLLLNTNIGETKAEHNSSSSPQIVNPEQYLASFVPIKKSAHVENTSFKQSLATNYPDFEMDFELHNGNLNLHSELVPNEFLVESGPFFPIKKVNYTVELEKNATKNLSVGQNTSSECVFFEIWTDGSIHPQRALDEAFFILHNLFKPQLQAEGGTGETF